MLKQKVLKIIHVIPSLRKGGAERLLINIISELHKREDVSCLIIALNEGNDYQELTTNLPIKVCNSKVDLSVLKSNRADINEFYEIVHKFKPHIIHSHLFEAEILSRWKILKGTIYFSHIHNNEKQFLNFDLSKFYIKRTLTNFYEKQFMLRKYKRCNNNFIAVSKHTETFLKDVFPYSFYKNIYYLPNAIDYNYFYFNKVEGNFIPEYKFVTIGRLVDNKNQMFLVDVIEELHKRNIKATLDILGDGENREAIDLKIKKKNLQNYIFLHGNVSNVKEFLQKSSLYLHAATYEPFGLVILEAMASGLPVISLDGGGNKELLVNGKNGFMISKPSASLFADKIVKSIEDKFLYNRMSEKANVFAKEYDIKNYIKRLIILYYDQIEKYYASKMTV